MMLSGDSRKEKRCYGCGQMGHLRGAEECKAGKDAVWGGAPKVYLDKIQRKFGATPDSGKRMFPSDDSKTPCPYWSSGDGYCKFAERCKFDHSGPQGGSKRARDFGKGGKGKGKGKSKGKGKGRGGGKGKRTSLMVQKKGDRFANLKNEGSSSMMVRDHGAVSEDKEESAETELYNLMRGNTVLMVTEDSDSDSDSEQGANEEVGSESSTVSEKSWAHTDPYEWRASLTSKTVPTWGNNTLPDEQEQVSANEWRERSMASDRRTRDEEIARGNSPPPKLDSEDFFNEGSSRKKSKPIYRNKHYITDKVEEEMSSSVENYTTGRFNSQMNQRKKELNEGRLSPHAKLNEESAHPSSKESSCFWSSECCRGEEETSSEEGDEEEDTSEDDEEIIIEYEEEDSSSDEESDDETISGIFDQIRNGTFDPRKKRKRFEKEGKEQERIVTTSSVHREDDADVATRGDCVMNTTEALFRLTKNEKDKWDEEDEWLIIKVPKKGKKWFLVDYGDGDVEDEFDWLEGPYLQQSLTVGDLVERRRSQSRTTRRRRGETEFRNDEELDSCDNEGNFLPTFSCDCCKRKRPKVFATGEEHRAPPRFVLSHLRNQEVVSDLSSESLRNGELEANLNEVGKTNMVDN